MKPEAIESSCFTALSAQTGYIMLQKWEMYHKGPGENTNIMQ